MAFRFGKKVPAYAVDKQRRMFLRSLALVGSFVVAGLAGFIPIFRKWVRRLRPPGALVEKRFLAACIKCGQCVQVCPVQAIKLADLGDGLGVGSPYIDPRAQACDFSCDVLQCVLACPTGALTHEISYPHEVKIARAALVRPHQCLAAKGEGFKGQARGPTFKGTLRYNEIDRWNPIPVSEHPYDLEVCDLCVRQCPIEIQIAQCEAEEAPRNTFQCPPEYAIRLAPFTDASGVARMRPEVLEGCTGCGVCEMICPAEPAAIELVDVVTRGIPV